MSFDSNTNNGSSSGGNFDIRYLYILSLKDRVMFQINQTGAGSGRQTSDAHQYSDGMKKLIIPDSEQHFLWSAIIKNIPSYFW